MKKIIGNNTWKYLIVILLIIFFIYVCNISMLPKSIIVFEGENVNIKTFYGINVKKEQKNRKVIQASSNIKSDIGAYELNLNLFGKIPLKEINVDVIPKVKVVPIGELIGVKMYASGVLIVGVSEIEGVNGIKYKPYEKSNLKEGDMIIELNSKKITSTNELINIVQEANNNEIKVKYVRSDKVYDTILNPVKSTDGRYKIGLWVRDATAGVGTLTFYDKTSSKFAALGHGIVDVDTGDIFSISNGELVTARAIEIKKGQKGNPGELRGTIDEGLSIGEIEKNTNLGVYGVVKHKENINFSNSKEYDVALRSEIKTGKAIMICEVENGKKEEYEIEIKKIYTSNNYDNKSMLIKIKDKKLLDKTGGIIQGMSGAPIIQDGKFIGAITNVFVSDPTTGYAIFGDLMIKQMNYATIL